MVSVRRFVVRWPFTSVGLASLGLLVIGLGLPLEALEASAWGSIVASLWRVLLLPAYLAGLAVVAAEGKLLGGWPSAPGWIEVVRAGAILLPFVALDLARRWLPELMGRQSERGASRRGGARPHRSNSG